MADSYDFSLVRHSKTPLSELIPEDKRTLAKATDSRSKSNAACDTSNTVSHGDDRDASCVRYQAFPETQEVFAPLHLVDETSVDRYNRNESKPPLLVQCDDCSGAGQITHDHPNDPWAKTWTCSMCDGTGEVIAGCECCREDATERFDGLMLCAAHAAEQKADAEAVA
jgi:hypothetical protein